MPADLVAVVLAALAGLLLPHTPRADPRRLVGRRRDSVQPRPGGRSAVPPADLAVPAVPPSGVAVSYGPPAGVAVPRWVPQAVGAAAGLAVLTGRGTLAAALVVATAALAAPGVVEAAERRRRSAAAARELPRVADLLAACLQAGLPLPAAAAEVGRVVGRQASGRLRHLVVVLGSPSIGAGADPADGWWRLERAVLRAAERGAPLADVLSALAADERDRSRWAAEEAARRVGVRAVGPLAACFLPAFLLVGVVPVVVGVAGSVLGDLR